MRRQWSALGHSTTGGGGHPEQQYPQVQGTSGDEVLAQPVGHEPQDVYVTPTIRH